ncbi:MAG TPA: transglycosylase domain-containing protein [Paludibacteraceae bacterium]|nr:transglycosylase domain-containing protein [Paludibacteraceae bacterium]HPT43529.1 transglycosylase domain-containing protein [Paludibacteraceae bacterium]
MNRDEIYSQINRIYGFLKVKLFQFINWREKRIIRFYGLPKWRKVSNTILTFFGLFLFYLILVDINFLWLFGKSPSLRAISNPPQSLSSEIISADGKLIGKYFNENRKLVKFEDISPSLINTLISTEDHRFYKHFGVDIRGLFGAMKDMIQGNPRGASTITQQLVKNMYKTRSQYSRGLLGSLPGLRLPLEKTKEWTAALKLEIFYSKNDILEMYLNTVSFGSNAYGIYTASKTYFNTTPDKLNYEQSAVLVGLLKAITKYNPYINPKNSLKRRNVVLNLLVHNKYITQQAADSLKEIPIQLNYNIEKPNQGIAPYFRANLTRFLEKWGETNGYDIYADGLKIYVTIDSRMQQYAEDAVRKQMKQLQRNFFAHWSGQNPWRDENGNELKNFISDIAKHTRVYRNLASKYNNNQDSIDKYMNLPRKMKVFDYDKGVKTFTMSPMDSIRYVNHFLHCGFVAMEPDTKYVKAWVGDVDYDNWQYDKVAQSKRQPGSTFKLFVYTAAMIAGKSPCDKITDKPITWGTGEDAWSPKNSTGGFSYEDITLKSAFAKSVNTVAAQLAKEVGLHNVAKCAHLLGIKSKLDEVPTLSLGASDVSLLEMVNAYSTVTGEGMYHSPIIVTKIVDKDGYTIYEEKIKPKRVLSYENAFLMTELLKGGITEPGGTSRALWNFDLMRWDTEFGGKTGTSSNYSDAWYIGVTPKLVGGAWVGAEHRSVHFRNGSMGQGSRTALPVFALFMEKVLSDKQLSHYRAKFPAEPKQPISRDYKCQSYVKPDTALVDSTIVEPIETLPVPDLDLSKPDETTNPVTPQ